MTRPGMSEEIRLDDLERRMRWLYGRIRATATDRVAQFDVTREVVELAGTAEQGRALSAELLEPAARTRYETDVVAWRDWQEEYESRRAEAVRAAQEIAETVPGSDARQVHERVYKVARCRLDELDASRDRLGRAADVAGYELRENEAKRVRYAEPIERGQQAWTELTSRLRAQIEVAVDRFEVLPKWFEKALGMSPPADAERWFRTGTEILAYRATYAIDDENDALGPEPPDQAPGHRLRWYNDLT